MRYRHALLLVAGVLAAGLSVLIALSIQRNRLYAVEGVSRIERDHAPELALIEAVDSGGVGVGGDQLGFGTLANRIYGKYPLEEYVKLAKSPDPIKAMLGLELLVWSGRDDYLTRHLSDRRPVTYLSGCTVHVTAPIGDILGRYYGIRDYAERNRILLGLFKVVPI